MLRRRGCSVLETGNYWYWWKAVSSLKFGAWVAQMFHKERDKKQLVLWLSEVEVGFPPKILLSIISIPRSQVTGTPIVFHLFLCQNVSLKWWATHQLSFSLKYQRVATSEQKRLYGVVADSGGVAWNEPTAGWSADILVARGRLMCIAASCKKVSTFPSSIIISMLWMVYDLDGMSIP